jgi:hypothetical protein
MRAACVAVTVATALVAAPGPAAGQAREVWASEDGRSTLELRAFYKLFGAGVRLQPGLRDATQALADLLRRARIEQPDAPLPDVVTLPGIGGSTAQTVRGWGRLLIENRVELSAGWQVDATLASDAALIGTGSFGRAVSVAGSEAASRRLGDFDRVLVDRGDFLLQHNLDLLAVKFILPKGELVVGRQVLSWGSGRFWNPTDLLSPFAPTDVDREVRHGVDAVRFSMPLGKTALLDLLYLPQQEGWAQGGVARAQVNVRGFDLSASAAKYVSDVVIGTDLAGDVGPLGVHAEVACTLALENLGTSAPVEVGERFVRGVAGVEWRPADKWVVGGEYYFNGAGAREVADYALELRGERVTRGEVFGAGRHYVGLTAGWQATDLLSAQVLMIANLADPSALVVPVIEHWARQRMIVRAGGYLPLGAAPDPGPLRRLTVADVLSRNAAFTRATSSLGLRSEYGASPAGVFAQLGIYF